MPKLGGLEIAKSLKGNEYTTRIIIITAYKDEALMKAAFSYGAKGFLLKDTALTEIKTCVEKVMNGGRYISSELSSLLLSSQAQGQDILFTSFASLTLTERKILRFVAQNKTTKDIANELFISYRTVENHRNNICKKLGISGASALLRFALDNKDKL